MLVPKYPASLSIGFRKNMFLLGLLLTIFSIVYSNIVNQKWSYIDIIPSQKWNTSQRGKDTFLCALGMLYSDDHVKRIGEESSNCTKYSGDEFLSEYIHYVKKIYFENLTVALNKGSTSVKHYLPDDVKIGDKFRFVILKAKTSRFDIVFQSSFGTKILFAIARKGGFVLTDVSVDGKRGPDEEKSPYPFYDFREYIIVLEVLAELWQIYVDNILFGTFVHRQPFTYIKKIRVTCYDGVTLLNYLNISEA